MSDPEHRGDDGGERAKLAHRIRARMPLLSPGLRRTAAFIEKNLSAVPTCSALELGRLAGVSDASVIRACRALGFDGLPGLKRAISEASGDRATQASLLRTTLGRANDDAEKTMDLVLEHEARLISNLGTGRSRTALTAAIARLHAARSIMVFGTGASGHLAGYMVTMLTRYGRNASVLDASGFSLADQMLRMAPGGVLLMLFFGRPYGEAEAALEAARALEIEVMMITENAHNPLVMAGDTIIEIKRSGSVSLPIHGAALTCLEALLMGLAAIDGARAVDSLDRLAFNRERIATAVRRNKAGQANNPRRPL